MTEPVGFEPFIDWHGINDEMAQDLAKTVREFRSAQEAFARFDDTSTGDAFCKAAADMLLTQHELATTVNAIQSTLFIVPVVIHVAGIRMLEQDDETNDRVVQRCARCGSVLQMWVEGLIRPTPDGPQEISQGDMVWWGEGEVVAKAPAEGGNRMYPVRDRELEEYEQPCPNLSELRVQT